MLISRDDTSPDASIAEPVFSACSRYLDPRRRSRDRDLRRARPVSERRASRIHVALGASPPAVVSLVP
jgi:hypothetical protein